MQQPHKIIDSIEYLKTLSNDELRELLLEDKYNKANLRELIRQLVAANIQLEKAYDYESQCRTKAEDKLEDLKSNLKNLSEGRNSYDD